MTIDALGGGTALTSTLAGLTGPAAERVRAQPTQAAEKDHKPAKAVVEGPEAPAEAAAEDESAAEVKSVDDIAGTPVERDREAAPTNLSILYDQDIDLFISRRVDPESGEVVRQFPYEEQLEVIRVFAEKSREDSEDHLDLSV